MASKTITYLSLFLAGVLLCFIFMQRCVKGNQIDAIQDSLNRERALNDTLIVQSKVVFYQNDSLKQKKAVDSAIFVKKIDSQSRVIASLQGRLNIKKDSIRTLYDNLKTFYLNHDTVALQATYDNLSTQLTDANNLLFAIQLARDSADNIRIVEIARLNQVINTLQDQIKQLKELLVESTTNASNLNKTALKALRKQKVDALLAKVGTGIAAILGIILIAHH